MEHPLPIYCLVLFCFCQLGQTIVAKTASKHTVEEAYNFLGIKPNPNGSFTRQIRIPMVPATPKVVPGSITQIALSKDITLGASNETFVRLYRPINLRRNMKLPLIIYFHGGDFVLFSATTSIFHTFCNNIAAQVPAIVASVEYRLAPEHRLPTAYSDAMDGIIWAKHQALHAKSSDPWINKYADFSRVYLLGSSAGGNIVYNVALRALDLDISPMKIKGLIMNQPYFGGVERTKSEIRLSEDAYIPLYVTDVLWSLALPKNANRDHKFCNPLTGGSYHGKVRRLQRCMVKGDSGDPLFDRQKKFVKLLKANGVKVVSHFNEGGNHGIELGNTTAAQTLYDAIKDFIAVDRP